MLHCRADRHYCVCVCAPAVVSRAGQAAECGSHEDADEDDPPTGDFPAWEYGAVFSEVPFRGSPFLAIEDRPAMLPLMDAPALNQPARKCASWCAPALPVLRCGCCSHASPMARSVAVWCASCVLSPSDPPPHPRVRKDAAHDDVKEASPRRTPVKRRFGISPKELRAARERYSAPRAARVEPFGAGV